MPAARPKSYFIFPLRGFILAMSACFASCGFVIWGLANETTRSYSLIAEQIPHLQEDVRKISFLSAQVSEINSPDISGAEENFETSEETQLPKPQKGNARMFRYVVVDEKCVVPDPSCRDCVLNEEVSEEFSSLLRSNPDTLLVYLVADDMLKKENCTSGATKFSDCLIGYIYRKFNGNYLCVKKLDDKYSAHISSVAGGRLILSNLTMGVQEYQEIEKHLTESSSMGFHTARR
jgi:hypothetical protein